MNFITAMQLVLSHYEDIVAAVALAEKMFPDASSGAKKLDFVRQTLAENEDLVKNLAGGNFEALWPYVIKVINLIVKYALAKKA